MPRRLSRALDALAAWPPREGLRYSSWGHLPGHVDFPADSDAVVEYVQGVSVWQQFGFALTPDERVRIRELWKHRPDLRGVLAEVVGFYVCDEFQRPFLRGALGGGPGGFAAWVAAYPDLRQPLVDHFREQTRRFQHPHAVVHACAVLTRDFGEAPEVWRAAAMAIHASDRRQLRLPPPRRSDFLRHDLETHGTIVPAEGEVINHYLAELGGEPLAVMMFGFWWHPVPRPTGAILSRLARASYALAPGDWSDADIRVYARALAALSPAQASFEADLPPLRAILEAARGPG